VGGACGSAGWGSSLEVVLVCWSDRCDSGVLLWVVMPSLMIFFLLSKIEFLSKSKVIAMTTRVINTFVDDELGMVRFLFFMGCHEHALSVGIIY